MATKAAAPTKDAAKKEGTAVQRGKRRRASGETAAEEETKKASEELEEPVAPELPEERAKKWRTPGFSRMKTSWSEEEWVVIAQAHSAVEGRILRNFADAYQVMNEVYEIIRTPQVDGNGEPVRDQFGFVAWKRTQAGGFEEDWSKLGVRQKESLLFSITTRMFNWEQRAADAWGEAMFAKAQWEERFAIDYDAPLVGTIDDRNAKANIGARDEKYFALFLSLYSRKADAIVRSLALLGQRIKDSMAP